jgi:hydroxymethylbilane synthase
VVTLAGLVADPDGKKIIRSERSGPRIEAGTLGYLVAEDVLAQGGAEILAAVYGAGVQG